MDDTQYINAIPFTDVLAKVGIKTFPAGYGVLGLYEGANKTDGWRLNVKQNFINDFSGKRPKGDVLSFIQEYLGLDFKNAVDYAKANFTLSAPIGVPTIEKKPFKKIEPLQTSTNISTYLSSRGIDYGKISAIVKPAIKKTYGKDIAIEGECIACEMKNMKKEVVGVQYRSIKEKAFYTDGNDGLFYSFEKEMSRDILFVVEGLTDYLSLRQFTPNVVGFKSCKTAVDDTFKAVTEKFEKIYLLFDNDTAGKDAKDKFKEKIDGVDIYEIIDDQKTDVNDMTMLLGSKVVDSLIEYSELTQPKYVEDYKSMLSENEECTFLPGKFTWGTTELDKRFGRFNGGTLCTITGESQSGKTEYAVFMGNENAKRGQKVVMLSLEMSTKDIYSRMALKKCGITKAMIDGGLDETQQYYVEKKVYELKELPITITGMKETTLESLVKLIRIMKKDEYEMFIIDSLDMITIEGVIDDTQRIGIVTKTMKDLAKELEINISFIHHYTKGSDKERAMGDRGLASMKGSVKVENNSDMVVRIARNLSNDEFAVISPIEKAEVRVSLLKDRVYGDPGTKTIYFQKGTYTDNFIQYVQD